VLAGSSLESRDEALTSLTALLVIGGAIALLLASLAGLGVAAAARRTVEAMRREAARVALTTPGRRLPVPPGCDKLARVGVTLNEMLARQERAYERERAFVSDASHELRTPLTMLKTELNVALLEQGTREQALASLALAAEETDRLAQLAEDLLVIARRARSDSSAGDGMTRAARLRAVPRSGVALAPRSRQAIAIRRPRFRGRPQLHRDGADPGFTI
jgi:two-component system OmpR family sensor kinase